MPVYLRNEILTVEIGEPGELYTGSRFDYSGNIVQVTLKNRHTFCTSEKPVFNTIYGFGLINEFDIDGPASYDEAKPGGFFLKNGIGRLLREDDQPYKFFHNYHVDPSTFKIEFDATHHIVYESESHLVNCFQTLYRKKISIEGNILKVDYFLKNIGTKTFSTEEYCHNFLSIDHRDLSADYNLEFNFDFSPERFAAIVDPGNVMIIGKNSVRFNKKPDGDIFIAELAGKTSCRASWKLINTRSKAGVSEEVSFESTKVNLWGNGHVVSPELFFHTKLNPGDEARWQRRYTFFEL
jgi:hypothetical protein